MADTLSRRVNTLTILGLSVGLAMDATAVSATRGFAAEDVRFRHVARVALLFGGFQVVMPLLGWFVGAAIGPLVAAWDHWIAFALLCAIGGKMLAEWRDGPEGAASSRDRRGDLFGMRVLLVLAVATSIDALAVGLTLPMLDAPLLWTLASIGIVTAVASAGGVLLGRRFGTVLGPGFDVVGGLVLISVGVKILVEHLGHT